jgi:hypothetical protein
MNCLVVDCNDSPVVIQKLVGMGQGIKLLVTSIQNWDTGFS